MTRNRRTPLPVVEANPSSPIADAYHSLRTNAQFRGVGYDKRIILITSASRSEGKTITACNLAAALSQSHQRVLLMDADMRNPTIHDLFQFSNDVGLSTVLKDGIETFSSIPIPEIPNLKVMPSGPQPKNPATCFSSRNFEELLSVAKYDFDVIVIDGPPVLSVSDTLTLSRIVDGTIFVIDARRTNRIVAQKAIGALQDLNVNIIGGVLNRVSKQTLKYPIGSAFSVNALHKSFNL